jgi:hypothetical protein
MVGAVRTWLRRAVAATAAVLTLTVLAVVSDVTPTANALKSEKYFQTGLPDLIATLNG